MNEKDYKEHLKGICCVEVSGEGCAACLTLMPVLQDVIARREDLKLIHVEANEENKHLLTAWEGVRVPTVLLMDGGEIFAGCHGYQPEEILDIWIDAKLEEHRKR